MQSVEIVHVNNAEAMQLRSNYPAQNSKRLFMIVQDNYCDCGLFLLTYVDFFTYGLPAAVRFSGKKQVDLTELEGFSTYPLFCQQQWFFPGNASALRGHIRNVLLQLFMEQVLHKQTPNSHLHIEESRGEAI